MSADDIAKAFVQHFYQTFDQGIAGLEGLYVSQRMHAGNIIAACCAALVCSICVFHSPGWSGLL